jgi:hypothetical protein
MVGKNMKAGCLPFYPALCILEAAWRIGLLANALGANEEIVWAIANAGNADGRVNLIDG